MLTDRSSGTLDLLRADLLCHQRPVKHFDRFNNEILLSKCYNWVKTRNRGVNRLKQFLKWQFHDVNNQDYKI